MVPSVMAFSAKVVAEDAKMTPEQRTQRWLDAEEMADLKIDDPTDIPGWICNNVAIEQREIRAAIRLARRQMTPLEARFYREAHQRWPNRRFRRYAPISVTVFEAFGPSVWYAPFLCRPKKLIVVIDDRSDFPYRIYGQNRALYERHGYTVLDFSEDLSCPFEQSVRDAMMAMIDTAIRQQPQRKAA